MNWLGVIMICAVGMYLVGDKKEETATPKQNKLDDEYYSYKYCRCNLSAACYDNWDCETIAYQLQDNWLRDDLRYLLVSGYSFERGIDELVSTGKIKL